MHASMHIKNKENIEDTSNILYRHEFHLFSEYRDIDNINVIYIVYVSGKSIKCVTFFFHFNFLCNWELECP